MVVYGALELMRAFLENSALGLNTRLSVIRDLELLLALAAVLTAFLGAVLAAAFLLMAGWGRRLGGAD
jgi:hypothetical protein